MLYRLEQRRIMASITVVLAHPWHERSFGGGPMQAKIPIAAQKLCATIGITPHSVHHAHDR
jgi:hypothetical protein